MQQGINLGRDVLVECDQSFVRGARLADDPVEGRFDIRDHAVCQRVRGLRVQSRETRMIIIVDEGKVIHFGDAERLSTSAFTTWRMSSAVMDGNSGRLSVRS